MPQALFHYSILLIPEIRFNLLEKVERLASHQWWASYFVIKIELQLQLHGKKNKLSYSYHF